MRLLAWAMWLGLFFHPHHIAPPPPPVPPHLVQWERLRTCEAPAGWATATGNGFYGGLQFTLGTWRSHGGRGMPQWASKWEQMWVAERVLRDQGWRAWPTCSRTLHLR